MRKLHYLSNLRAKFPSAITMKKTLNLTLFLRHMGSLRTWHHSGILDREMDMYRSLQKKNVNIDIISHGGRDEYDFSARVPGMKILCNWTGLPGKIYERRAHLIHARHLLQSDVLVTADTTGIVTALRTNWAWQVPLVYRIDYHWSTLSRISSPKETRMIENIVGLEKKA